MLTGFGMQYGIQSIVDKQFDTIMIYDGVVALKDNLTDDEKQEAFQAIDDLDGVTDQMFVKMSNVDVSQNDTTMSASLLVPEQSDDFDQYMDLHTRSDKTEISLTDSGVVLSEKLARNCGVSAGDTVEITPNNVEKTVPVLGVNENYAGNYVYMTTDLFTETFGDIGYNCILINTKGDDYQNDISTAITENELFAGSSFNKDTADNFRNIIRNLNSVVIVIIISAGALAFIVLYNLVNINVGERIRELATLKVLGYRDHETSSYIYRENIICTIIGILLGLIGGIFLERFVIRTAEVEAAMFSPEIPFYCFVFAGLLTLAFTLVVNVALHFKLKKLDMVESLKSVD
jgi:putative ABC transport system permease protein